MVPSFLENWCLGTEWGQFVVGGRIRVVVMPGVTEPATIHGIGDVDFDDKVVITRTDSGKLVTLTKPSQAYVPKTAEAVSSIGKGPDEYKELKKATTEEKRKKMANGKKTVVEETVPVGAPEVVIVEEKKGKDIIEPQAENSDFPLSMASLSKESGVSVLTLRKYVEKHNDKISFITVGGAKKFALSAVEVVKDIKNSNVDRWGPKKIEEQ